MSHENREGEPSFGQIDFLGPISNISQPRGLKERRDSLLGLRSRFFIETPQLIASAIEYGDSPESDNICSFYVHDARNLFINSRIAYKRTGNEFFMETVGVYMYVPIPPKPNNDQAPFCIMSETILYLPNDNLPDGSKRILISRVNFDNPNSLVWGEPENEAIISDRQFTYNNESARMVGLARQQLSSALKRAGEEHIIYT